MASPWRSQPLRPARGPRQAQRPSLSQTRRRSVPVVAAPPRWQRGQAPASSPPCVEATRLSWVSRPMRAGRSMVMVSFR